MFQIESEMDKLGIWKIFLFSCSAPKGSFLPLLSESTQQS